MFTLKIRSFSIVVLITALLTVGLMPAVSWGSDPGQSAQDLLALGKSLPSTIGLRVWTNQEAGQPPRTGDRLIVSVQADRDAFLTVISVSREGSVLVVFPNKETPDSLLKKDKAYALFGDDSALRLKLGKQVKDPSLVCFASGRKPDLDALKLPQDKSCLAASADSPEQIKALKTALEAVATKEGFCRVPVSFSSDPKEIFEVKLVDGPGRLMGTGRPMLKKLPTSVDSKPPETVIGVQGVKEPKPGDQ